MRVLHLLGNREDTGGILSVVRSIQNATRGACEHVVLVHEEYLEKRLPKLDYRRSPHATDEEASHGRLLKQAIKSFTGLRRLLKAEPFDVIHGHTRGAFPLVLMMAATGHRRCVFTSHTYANRVGMYRTASRWKRIRWVFLTPTMAQHYGVQAVSGGVELVSACCSDTYFSSPTRPVDQVSSDRPVRLVGLGNIVQWKRWDILLDAMFRLSPDLQARLRCTVYGPTTSDAPAQKYAADLRRKIQESGLGERFRLPGPTSDVAGVLAESDWYMVLSRNEPCSVALIEALAGGMPALVSASGGNLDIVKNGATGIHFRTDDVDDLASALKRIANGDYSLESPSGIRESVRGRSASAVSREYLRIYREVISSQ